MRKGLVKRFKTGATLVELTITLAIVSILSVVIISFAAVVRNYSRSYSGTYSSYSDFDSVRLGFQKWLTHFDNEEFGLSLANNQTRLVATSKNNASTFYSLTFLADSNTFVGYYPEYSDAEYKTTEYYFGTTTTIKKVTFDIYQSSSGKGCLVECKATYDKFNTYGTSESLKTIEFFQNMYVAGIL